jgi:hypothetical protein
MGRVTTNTLPQFVENHHMIMSLGSTPNSAVQNFNGACDAAVARMTRRGGVLALVRERCMLNKRPNPGTTIPNKTSRRAIKNHD